MERSLIFLAAGFITFQAYNFLQEGGLSNNVAQRLFWLILCLTLLVFGFIIYLFRMMDVTDDQYQVPSIEHDRTRLNTPPPQRINIRSRSPLRLIPRTKLNKLE
jgi:hypothetical protein